MCFGHKTYLLISWFLRSLHINRPCYWIFNLLAPQRFVNIISVAELIQQSYNHNNQWSHAFLVVLDNVCQQSVSHTVYPKKYAHGFCFVVVIHWLILPYPSGLLHWHCGNLTNAPVPAKQPWWIWINTSCEFIMNDCITTTKQSTTKPCAYFLGYTVIDASCKLIVIHLMMTSRHPNAFPIIESLWFPPKVPKMRAFDVSLPGHVVSKISYRSFFNVRTFKGMTIMF